MAKKPLAYRGDEPFVFVSYAHADAELAYPLISGLQERGLRIWFDDGMDVGDLWDEVIPDHVEQCAAMLCLVSTRFTDSNNCLDEIHYAKEQKKELMILHLEDKELPRSFRFRYGRFHALKLSEYPEQSRLVEKLSATPKLRCCLGQAQEGTQEPEGSPEELYQKGKACYEGNGVPQSYEEAVKCYRKSAELGHPRAMRNLGFCYERGHGVAQSWEKAIMWYCRAADLGDADAMNDIAYCYEYGKGVTRSYEEAVKWYRRAVDLGNADAMRNLGNCYFEGRGVPQSYDEAVTWIRRAADAGNTRAMYSLIGCYSGGMGVAKDKKQAEYWMNRVRQAEEEASQ